jgi:recombination protein RecA
MTKAKKEVSDIDAVLASITKEYGEGIAVSPNFLVEKDPQILPVSPSLDLGLSGGIPEGSWFLISGPPKYGKTTTALQFAANAQKEENGGRHVFYMDVEGRLKTKNLLGINGLDLEKFTIIHSVEERILTGEEMLTMAVKIVKAVRGCILIIDSLSALCPATESAREVTPSMRSTTPKMVSLFCKQLGQVVPIMDTTIVCIQHIIANTSGFGKKSWEDGGAKIQYQADTKIKALTREYYPKAKKDGDAISPLGQIIKWEVVESALGPPGQKPDSILLYNHGLDNVRELFKLGTDFGVIEKAGSWFTLSFLDGCEGFEELAEKKIQGEENIVNMIREEPDIVDALDKSVREVLMI